MKFGVYDINPAQTALLRHCAQTYYVCGIVSRALIVSVNIACVTIIYQSINIRNSSHFTRQSNAHVANYIHNITYNKYSYIGCNPIFVLGTATQPPRGYHCGLDTAIVLRLARPGYQWAQCVLEQPIGHIFSNYIKQRIDFYTQPIISLDPMPVYVHATRLLGNRSESDLRTHLIQSSSFCSMDSTVLNQTISDQKASHPHIIDIIMSSIFVIQGVVQGGPTKSDKPTISAGAIAGIVIGVIGGVMVIGAVLFFAITSKQFIKLLNK